MKGANSERHVWPRTLRVFVNLTQVAAVEEPKKLKKRRDDPLDLTAFLQSGRNHLQFSVSDMSPPNFILGLILCGSLSNASIINTVPVQSYERCRDRMKHILQVKTDIMVDHVNNGYRELDLRCPISLDKLRQPARGTMCDHLRCFDLDAFVSVNRLTSNINLRWICPICRKLLLPKDLIQDAYMKAIVDFTPTDCLEVSINEDTAEWRAVETTQGGPRSGEWSEDGDELYRNEGDGQGPPVNQPDCIDLDGDDTELEEPYLKKSRPTDQVPPAHVPNQQADRAPVEYPNVEDIIELE
jgi:hypothetical protein